MRRLVVLGCTIAAALALGAAPAMAGGPPSGVFYAEGQAFRTVVTPASLPATGPFDLLYMAEGFAPVSDAAPGDQDYNGGRWQVVLVEGDFASQPTSDADILAHATSLTFTDTRFVCPLIRA